MTNPGTFRYPSRSERLRIRGIEYRLRHWGVEGKPRLLLLHGWADVSATFQFVAEHLADHWHLIAPDWRGCGESQWMGQSYLLTDLVLDLNALVAHCFGNEPARVAGHSMGANVACLLAATAPQRIAALATLDAYGSPLESPQRMLDQLAQAVERERHPLDWTFDSLGHLEDRLLRANARLTPAQARFLAGELGEPLPGGRARMRIDVPWRDTFAQLSMAPYYREAFSRIQAPVLLVGASDSYVAHRINRASPGELDARLAAFPRLQHVVLDGTSHNLHHDRPKDVAALLHTFFQGESSRA